MLLFWNVALTYESCETFLVPFGRITKNKKTGSQKSFEKETLEVLLAAGGDPPKDPVSLHLPRSGLNMSNDMSFKLQKTENAAKTSFNLSRCVEDYARVLVANVRAQVHELVRAAALTEKAI